MITLIGLDEYYNLIGKQLFPEWSKETVYYYSERQKDLKHLRHAARKTLAKAMNQIWSDGKVKVSFRLEQGYVDPPFAIESFDFAHSGCISVGGDYYRCKLEINKEARGRPKRYDLDDVIREYVRIYHIKEGVPFEDISPDSVVSYVQNFLASQSSKDEPHHNTIRNHLRALYPQCKKTSKNSKK